MATAVGTVFTSHAGWRIVCPDSAWERMVLPADCAGDLIVDGQVGDRVTLQCDGCPYEVTTTEAAPARVDFTEPQSDQDMPF